MDTGSRDTWPTPIRSRSVEVVTCDLSARRPHVIKCAADINHAIGDRNGMNRPIRLPKVLPGHRLGRDRSRQGQGEGESGKRKAESGNQTPPSEKRLVGAASAAGLEA